MPALKMRFSRTGYLMETTLQCSSRTEGLHLAAARALEAREGPISRRGLWKLAYSIGVRVPGLVSMEKRGGCSELDELPPELYAALLEMGRALIAPRELLTLD